VLSLGVAAAARGLQNGAYEAVSRLATALQAFDETNEMVAQVGMQADHGRGDCSAVRRRHRRLCEALKRELGVAPSQETETLLGELTRPERPPSAGSKPAPSAPTAPASADGTPLSIGLLPITNRSGVQQDDVFADGVVEDLAASLPSPWIKVVAANATALYRKGPRDLRQIGRDLEVRCLLEGNVRRVGEDLRLTAQLVEAESESILWTQKFDRPLAELAALQEDLVTEVAAHLGVQVIRAEMEHALQKPGDISAYEARMRGGAYAGHATRSAWEAAVAETKRAVDIDPNDGLAYALLAASQGRVLHLRGGDDPELAREIVDNIRKARELDPNSPAALAGIGSALAALRKLPEALRFAERAVALSPTLESSRLLLGAILVRMGRSDEAIEQLDTFERLGPNSSLLYYSYVWRAAAHLQAGRHDQALDAAERAERLLSAPEALIQSMLCLAKLNRPDRARDALRRLRDTDPELSGEHVENLVRSYYWGSDAVDELVETVRALWAEASSEASSA
jgi:TolB-like protein/Flp pilus assembly protein TadD